MRIWEQDFSPHPLQAQAVMRDGLRKLLIFQALPNLCDLGESCARRDWKIPSLRPPPLRPRLHEGCLGYHHCKSNGNSVFLTLSHPASENQGHLLRFPFAPNSPAVKPGFFHLVSSTRLDSSSNRSPRPWDQWVW